jgi:hypothetical protein
MGWPGHDEAPHFQIPWEKHPRLKWTIDTLTTSTRENRRIVIILLSAAIFAGAVALGSTIKNSIVRTLERIGTSAELRGHAFSDVLQPSVEKPRSPNLSTSRILD